MKDDVDEPLADGELGFEPAVSATGGDPADTDRRARPRGGVARRNLRKKLSAAGVLAVALVSIGSAYTFFASNSGAADSTAGAQAIQRGRQLFDTTCITCHGANLEGVPGRGVSLLGVGGAAVYFQVSTGRMPAAGQGSEQYRKTPAFTDSDIRALAAFVQSMGGGTAIPTGALRDDSNIADGGTLFRLNCASCHGTTFRGAPLSAGKTAPSLNEATDLQIYTAMLTGPESMPIFSDNQITADQKRAIVSYIQTLKASKDPGGNGIDRIGPVSEAVVIWVAGVGAILIAILWIGAKTQ